MVDVMLECIFQRNFIKGQEFFFTQLKCYNKQKSKNWELGITTFVATVFTGVLMLAIVYGFGMMECPYGKYSSEHMCFNC